MGSYLRNVLTISFHGVKFLLKPCCKHLSAFLDGGAILLDERGTNTCDTKIFVCLITREAGVLPTPGTGRAVTSNILQSCKKNLALFEVKVARVSCLRERHSVPFNSGAALLKQKKYRMRTLLNSYIHSLSVISGVEFGNKPDWDAFYSICSGEDIHTASHLSCRWHSPCCKQ